MTHLQMIDKVKYLAIEDENVSAVFMYGSFTKNEGDKYSDIEFYIFLNNMQNFSAEKWINQILPVAMYFTNEHGSEVAIFDNLVRGEFHFMIKDEIEIIKSWEGMVTFSDFDQMNIVDKEGLLTKTLNQIKIKSPNRSTVKNIKWLSQSLLNVLLVTNNLIKRGEFAHAHQNMFYVQKYLLWLIRIANNNTQHWESPTKSLEKDINTKSYSAYKTVVSDLDPENILTSYNNSLKLTEKLFDQLNVEQKLKDLLYEITLVGTLN